MAISVIVSNLNGARYLPKLLDSLNAQEWVTLEIIVVDRYSTDDSHRILTGYPSVTVLEEPPETGLVAGYSKGARYARYENLFFCNEDMWFSTDCLRRLESQFLSEEKVGAIMPVQLSYDGSLSVNIGTWFKPSKWFSASPYPFRASTWRIVTTPESISGINAGACLISRSAYDDVGGWDTTFFLDYEDTDLSIRLWQHRWRCRIEPRAVVYHAVGASNHQVITDRKIRVGDKRYVAALSNELTIILKTFTGWSLVLLPPLIFGYRIVSDLFKARFKAVMLDIAGGLLTIKRVPAIVRYRHINCELNSLRPGQEYYCDPRFVIVEESGA